MIKYLIKGDPEPVTVAGPEELVKHMNETAKHPSADAFAYMLDYSKRSVIMRDVDIRATDFESFINDLIAAGDIKVLN